MLWPYSSGMDILTVNRLELLNFMNGGDVRANGHHSAITALMGEPLAAALLLHYLRDQGKQPSLISWKVTPGTTKGNRLDAWIFDGVETLYQTEIKMWAGNAIGGLRLKPDMTEQELTLRGRKQWLERIWNEREQAFYAQPVSKVLGRLVPPPGYEHARVEPLLCLWWLVQPETGESGAWFRHPVVHERFHEVNVFSLTRYLLDLQTDVLDLSLPLVTERLEWLGRILSPHGQHWTEVFHARNRIYNDAELIIDPPPLSP